MSFAIVSLALAAQVSLQWNAPPSCPPRDAVLERIGVLVGVGLDPDAPTRLAVSATVTVSGSSFFARFTVTASASARTLTAPACPAVAEAIAVIAALAYDAAPPPEPSPPPAPPPARLAPLTPSPVQRRFGEARPAPVGLLLGISGGAELGSRPALGSSFELRGGVTWWRLSLEVGYTFRPPNTETVRDGVGLDARVDTFTVRFCHAAPWVGGEFFGCLGGELGTVRVRPFGTGEEVLDRPWRASTLGVGQRIRLYGPIFGALRVQVVIPSTRPDFRIDGVERVFTPSAVGISGGFGIDVLFL